MKKSEEASKIKGTILKLNKYIEWEIINKKIGELQISQKEAENIKNEIKRREADFMRNKYF